MVKEISTNQLERDFFGIPILPDDVVSINSKGNLDAVVHVFTDITPQKEKYIAIEFNNVSTTNVLPDFTYTKPDPQGLDPRKIENIKFIDESILKKARSGYVLLGTIPSVGNKFKQFWGMRNHLHQPISVENLGIVCAVKDAYGNWSVRNYFEELSVKGIFRKDL